MKLELIALLLSVFGAQDTRDERGLYLMPEVKVEEIDGRPWYTVKAKSPPPPAPLIPWTIAKASKATITTATPPMSRFVLLRPEALLFARRGALSRF